VVLGLIIKAQNLEITKNKDQACISKLESIPLDTVKNVEDRISSVRYLEAYINDSAVYDSSKLIPVYNKMRRTQYKEFGLIKYEKAEKKFSFETFKKATSESHYAWELAVILLAMAVLIFRLITFVGLKLIIAPENLLRAWSGALLIFPMITVFLLTYWLVSIFDFGNLWIIILLQAAILYSMFIFKFNRKIYQIFLAVGTAYLFLTFSFLSQNWSSIRFALMFIGIEVVAAILYVVLINRYWLKK